MKDWVFHNSDFGVKYFGIRYGTWNFFTLLSFSLYDIDKSKPSKKFNPKIRFFFQTLCLPTAKARFEAMRK